MEFALFWIAMAVITAAAAQARGRNVVLWFVLGMVFSLLALLAVLVMGNVGGETVSRRTHVRCPDCREAVRKDARKCKHCGCDLIPQ